MLLRIYVERFAAQFLHQRTECDEVDIRIFEVSSRSGYKRRSKRTANPLGFVRCSQSPGVLQIDIRRQPGIMRQQLADRYVALFISRKFRKILRYRIVEVKLMLFV